MTPYERGQRDMRERAAKVCKTAPDFLQNSTFDGAAAAILALPIAAQEESGADGAVGAVAGNRPADAQAHVAERLGLHAAPDLRALVEELDTFPGRLRACNGQTQLEADVRDDMQAFVQEHGATISAALRAKGE